MESMMNDPSFRDLVAKHMAEQMISKSMMSMEVPMKFPTLSIKLPANLPELPAAPVNLPELPAAPVNLPELPAAPAKLPELPAAPVKLSATLSHEDNSVRKNPKLDMPLEVIMSGKKRPSTEFRAPSLETNPSNTARQLIRRALAEARPIPYSFSFNRANLYKILLPRIESYSPEEILSLNIEEFLTRIIPHSYDIFMERRPELKKLGVKLIPLGIYFYKYPKADITFPPIPYRRIGPHIHEFMNRAKEFIISTFLRILTDRDNIVKYRYDLDIHPNWRCENTFCKIYSSSSYDLDHVMDMMFDSSFSRRI